ncbi:MAG: hypothetical protein HJJLKODD_01244 [Phycisphaerae bacterium]|nr:hypothetical protein [Phycisphaerae bacterium]
MSVSVDLISIGTLSRNRFWNETGSRRASHATTTLLRDGSMAVLVDPSLPAEILRSRLDERTGLTPERVNQVFLTCFRPIHRRGLELFRHATWLMHADELGAVRHYLEGVQRSSELKDEPVDPLVRAELSLLSRIEPAPDELTESIHLFPCAGTTPGAAALLALQPDRTIAVAGDAVISRDYYERRQVFEQHSDVQAAVQALVELIEIADWIIPGHDDWIFNER